MLDAAFWDLNCHSFNLFPAGELRVTMEEDSDLDELRREAFAGDYFDDLTPRFPPPGFFAGTRSPIDQGPTRRHGRSFGPAIFLPAKQANRWCGLRRAFDLSVASVWRTSCWFRFRYRGAVLPVSTPRVGFRCLICTPATRQESNHFIFNRVKIIYRLPLYCRKNFPFFNVYLLYV